MKNYEVGIIVVAIGLIGYLWWKNSGTGQTANPTNATSQGFIWDEKTGADYNPMMSNPRI